MERNLTDYFQSRLWPGFIAPKKFKLGSKTFVTNKTSGLAVDGVDSDAVDVTEVQSHLESTLLAGFDPCGFDSLLEALRLKSEEIRKSERFCTACRSTRHILCPWCSGESCFECEGNGSLDCACALTGRDYPLVAFRVHGVCFDAVILQRAWGIFGGLESSERRLLVNPERKILRVDCDWGSYFQAGVNVNNHSNCTIWEVQS